MKFFALLAYLRALLLFRLDIFLLTLLTVFDNPLRRLYAAQPRLKPILAYFLGKPDIISTFEFSQQFEQLLEYWPV